MKYDKNTIIDYINGNDIEEYNIDDLENDKDFMKLVIELSNDEKFYNLCSDNVKNNYEFIKYLIFKFKDKLDFICNVANYYLDNVEDNLERIELIIIMNELTKNNNEINSKYKLLSETILTAMRVEIKVAKLKIDDNYVNEEIGMGFLLIYDDYNTSKIILDFFAKNLINEIFKEYDIDLEKELHNKYNNFEDITKEGINNFMINYISNYDTMLSSYLSQNIYLMNEFRNKLESIKVNWNKYNIIDERTKYNMILDKVHEYMEEIENNFSFSESEILYYIGKKLGIAEKIAKYDYISKDTFDMIINDLDDDYFESQFKLNSQDYFYYKTLLRIVSSIAFDNEINSNSNDKDNSKLIRINFNK